MGYRAHVCTTYQVHYDFGAFNHSIDELEELLNGYTFKNVDNCDIEPVVNYISDDGSVMELNPAGLQQLVEDLKAERIDPSDFPFTDYSQTEVSGILETWLNSYDKSNDFIRIECF